MRMCSIPIKQTAAFKLVFIVCSSCLSSVTSVISTICVVNGPVCWLLFSVMGNIFMSMNTVIK